jgi:hypothetical protein
MSERIRVFLMFDNRLPEPVRAELGSFLEDAGWVPASDDETCFVCRAQADDLQKIERRVRKSIEFAAFTSGQNGTFPFVLKIGDAEPMLAVARVGGLKTEPVKARASGLDFATERIPGGGTDLPRELQGPSVTQLKTAF